MSKWSARFKAISEGPIGGPNGLGKILLLWKQPSVIKFNTWSRQPSHYYLGEESYLDHRGAKLCRWRSSCCNAFLKDQLLGPRKSWTPTTNWGGQAMSAQDVFCNAIFCVKLTSRKLTSGPKEAKGEAMSAQDYFWNALSKAKF